MKYRKKPVIVEAFQLKNCKAVKLPDWVLERDDIYCSEDSEGNVVTLRISTLEGDMFALNGDWIIKSVKGELYPCKPDIFEATYELVPDQPEGETKS